jgi:glycosyltransferase involved in cell wall biosynthesis
MKLIINGDFLAKPKTGMGQYLLQILEHQKWDYEIIILIPEYLKYSVKNLPKSIQRKIQYIPIWYKRNDLIAQIVWEKYLFPKAVLRLEADIVWSPHPSLSYIPQIYHIMTVHDVIYWRLPEYIPNWRTRIYVKLLEQSIVKANKIITVSQFSAQEIGDIFNIPVKSISIIYNSSSKLAIKNSNLNIKSKYIFYEGGLDIRKNITQLIEAFRIIAPKHLDLNLYIAGNYFVSSLIPNIPALIAQYDLEDRVKLLGYISDEDMVKYIQGAEMLVYPSLYEGFGIPIVEGLSLGTPVITSNIGAMKEVGGDAAVLVNPYSAKSIARGILSILTDDLLKQSLIYKGYERAQEFDWNISARQLGEILNNQ